MTDNYGYIPDEFAPEDVAEFNALTGKYDPTGQPAIVVWNTLEPHVREQADTMDKIRSAGWIILWWNIARYCKIPIWESNQGQLGSCAGWSAANGYMITVLYQMMLGAFRFVAVNPLAMWVRTKNWSMSGGQTMSKVMIGGNRLGNYPVQRVGEYGTKLTKELIGKIESATDEATLHQFGACRLTQERGGVSPPVLVHRIILCLRAGMVVCIGNSVRVSGSKIDSNNMRVATIGGTWSHATLLDGYIEVNGTVYLHWTNSHGNRYMGADRFNTPESGCWMTIKTLTQFCSGRYTDAFCIYRAEAPVDAARTSFTPATLGDGRQQTAAEMAFRLRFSRETRFFCLEIYSSRRNHGQNICTWNIRNVCNDDCWRERRAGGVRTSGCAQFSRTCRTTRTGSNDRHLGLSPHRQDHRRI